VSYLTSQFYGAAARVHQGLFIETYRELNRSLSSGWELMATQLESQRFFTAEVNPYATAETAQALNPASQPDYLPALWTPFLSGICVFCTVFGVWGILGGFLSIVSLLWMENSMDVIETMETSSQFKAAVEAQVAWQPLAVATQCFRIFVGFAFIIGAILLKTKTDYANKTVALILVVGIVYGMLNLVYTYFTSAAAVEVAAADENVKGAAMVVALVIAGVIFLMKLGIYGSMIGYLSSKKVSAMFVPREKSTASVGSVEFIG